MLIIDKLRLQIVTFESEISEFKRKTIFYVSEIERMKLLIAELESRSAGTRIVEKIVERVVYRDRP